MDISKLWEIAEEEFKKARRPIERKGEKFILKEDSQYHLLNSIAASLLGLFLLELKEED